MSKGKTMKVYGITGSIACGKSTVTHYLIERGYLVVDADLISRNALTIDQECILKVQELFGCVKDGIVDRKALGRIVFHDKNAKKQLEAIIHPYVNLIMKEEIEKNKERDCIFLDIPLLYESHLEYLCDEIIVVYLDEQRQVQRLMARDHIDESYAYTIINNQISSLKKREMADIVFDNNQGIEELYKQIDEFIESCKFQPLSATKIIVNKEEIEELLRLDEAGSQMENKNVANPEQVRQFLDLCQPDSLAIGIGNAHGYYKGEPDIKLEVLEEVGKFTDIPFVLHGCTGMREDIIKEAIKLGVAKINFGTEIRYKYVERYEEALKTNHQGHSWKLSQMANDALTEDIKKIIRLAGSEGKALD